MYDAIIIGTGPAGLSVALNLQIHKKTFLWFGSKTMSDKVQKAELIRNYPGLTEITGKDLFAAFQRQITQEEIQIEEKTVTNVMRSGEHYMLLADNEVYETKTLILCMGVMSARVLQGEEALLGKGVSYCATCDGMLYRGKKIAVLCNAQKYEHEVTYLAELAEKVYYFPTFQDSSVSGENIELSRDFPVQINGESRVESITLKSGEICSVDGVFCLRNAIAPTTLIPDLQVENGHIKVDRQGATNLLGCFAAGDCTGRPYQYAKAVGEGNVAAHSCVEYLSSLEKK